jgi:hypothetical protein
MPIDTLKPGTKPPDEINVVVEIPKGSGIKYEINPKSGEYLLTGRCFPQFFILITMALSLKQRKKVEQIQLMYSYLEVLLYCPSR